MYWNDTHILIYLAVAIVGGIVGQFLDYVSKIFLEEKRILSKENFKKYKRISKPRYSLIVINIVLYCALLYRFGVSLDFFRYAPLCSMLICAFIVDYKIQIIPNRLNLTIFELGLVFVFIFGMSNLNLSKDLLEGMFAGGGIFLLITLIGGLIAGKEAMGLGDVKLVGALGLYFGLTRTIMLSVLSFLVGAIGSIALILTKKNRKDGYVPFGPFIVISTIITIFMPADTLWMILIKIFTLGM